MNTDTGKLVGRTSLKRGVCADMLHARVLRGRSTPRNTSVGAKEGLAVLWHKYVMQPLNCYVIQTAER